MRIHTQSIRRNHFPNTLTFIITITRKCILLESIFKENVCRRACSILQLHCSQRNAENFACHFIHIQKNESNDGIEFVPYYI